MAFMNVLSPCFVFDPQQPKPGDALVVCCLTLNIQKLCVMLGAYVPS